MIDVTELLPHRKPFLFVDRIEKAEPEEIIGYKRFGADEFFFAGHFPDYPVVPGVVLIETMAQCGGAGARLLSGSEDALFFLATVSKAKFKRQVRPNEEVKMVIENLRLSEKMIKQKGMAFVGDEIAAEAEWLCISGGQP